MLEEVQVYSWVRPLSRICSKLENIVDTDANSINNNFITTYSGLLYLVDLNVRG